MEQNLELAGEVLRQIRERINSEGVVDRAQQYWDQLYYDSYFRGQQRAGEISNVGGRMAFMPYGVSNSDRWSDQDAETPPDFNYNLFRRGVRMFTALFGVRSPHTRAVPINPRNQDHIRRARTASRISTSLDPVIDPAALQSRLSFLLGKSGTVFAYTRWVSSDEFGSSFVPDLAPQSFELAPPYYECPVCKCAGPASSLASPYCPECSSHLPPESFDQGLSETMMVPGKTGKQVLNGSVAVTLHTLASVAIPPGYLKLNDCPWLALLEERDIGQLAKIYGIPASEITPFGNADFNDFSGAHARAAIGSYNGRSSAALGRSMGTEGRYWVHRSQYALISNEQMRAELEYKYPNGVKISVVSGRALRCEHEALTEVWSSCLPEETDTLLAPPYLADTIPMTDLFTDAMELPIEAMERSIPVNLFDPSAVSSQDLRNHGRRHASFIPSKQSGRDLRSAIESFRTAEFRPEMVQLAEAIFKKNDEMQGMLPIIWGSVAGAETAFETSSAKNQALAMLAIPWVQMRQLHQSIQRQAILQAAKHSDGKLHLPVSIYPAPSNAIEVASLAELADVSQGGWRIESDEQMPLSASQIKEQILHLLTNSPPEVIQALGLLHPVNLPLINSYLSFPGIRSPVMEAVEAVNALLQELLANQPVPSPDGMGLLPSEQLDAYLYEPSLVVEVLKPWLVSDEGRTERATNEAGWLNVRLFAESAQQILEQQQLMEQQQQLALSAPGAEQPQPVPAGT